MAPASRGVCFPDSRSGNSEIATLEAGGLGAGVVAAGVVEAARRVVDIVHRGVVVEGVHDLGCGRPPYR